MADEASIRTWVLPRLLAEQAAALPDRPFLQLVGRPPITFAAMERRARGVAGGLSTLGLRRGDRLLVMLGNSEDFVAAWLAAARLGAVFVPVNTALRGDFLAYVANDSGALLAIVGAEHLPAIAAIEEGLPALADAVVVAGDARTSAPSLRRIRCHDSDQLHRTGGGPPPAEVAVHDIAAIMYTSGTTGRSKGVLLPFGHLHLNPTVYIEQLGLTSDDVLYTCLPLFHANGLLLGVYAALILGTRVVVSPGFSASRWAGEINAAGATVTNLLGVMTDFVLKQPPSPGDAASTLRVATAVPFSPGQARIFEGRFGVRLASLYGSTEINCPIYRRPGADGADASCGRIVDDWFEGRLVDPDTDLAVPVGAPGELVVRHRLPWTVMAGYHNQPDATLAAWRNLWFHTGDLMRRDEAGNFYYLDRLKDCIRRRGENISSSEVEEVLSSHPGVREVAVVGIRSPFDEHEQEVKACIVEAEGMAVDPAELNAFCAARMPAFAVPRFIEVYPELPKTPTAKVVKSELRMHGIREGTWVSPDADGRRRLAG